MLGNVVIAKGNVIPLPQITLGFAEGLQMRLVPRGLHGGFAGKTVQTGV